MLKRMLAGIAASAMLMGLGASAPAVAAPAPAPEVTALTTAKLPKLAAVSPKGIKAPKGIRPADGSADLGKARALAACSPTCFMYSGASQFLGGTDYTSGFAANLHVYPTYTNPADFHSLGEISVQSNNTGAAGGNAVEVGFTMDPVTCGAGNSPCLFVFWWKNGIPQCYNGCGFVPSSTCTSNPAQYCAGESLLPVYTGGNGNPKRVEIRHIGTAWWVAYDLAWIGAYPDALWTAATPSGPGVTFTQGKLMQGFYEVAASTTTPCTDLGNGFVSTNGSAARVGTAAYSGTVSPVGLTPTLGAGATYAPYPAPNITAATTSAHGGPGTGGVRNGC